MQELVPLDMGEVLGYAVLLLVPLDLAAVVALEASVLEPWVSLVARSGVLVHRQVLLGIAEVLCSCHQGPLAYHQVLTVEHDQADH